MMVWDSKCVTLEKSGAKVWRGDSPGTRSGNQAGFSYFTVQVDRDG